MTSLNFWVANKYCARVELRPAVQAHGRGTRLAGPKREKTLCRVHAFQVAGALSIAKTDGSVLNIRASHEPASAAPFEIRAFGRFVSIHSRALLLLQGQPLDEPVVQHGPFVMNTEAEIHRAVEDYRAGRL